MHVFRGARFLMLFGHHTLKCDQRSIVTVGVTALCQVTVKKQGLLNTNTGIANSSPPLTTTFSTFTDNKHDNVNTLYVGGYNFPYDVKYLKELFSQFGEVKFVRLPLRVENNDTKSSDYRYAFISFYTKESCAKAVLAETIITQEEGILKIKERQRPERESEINRTFVIHGLPADVTVQQICGYFKDCGDVELVNLFIEMSSVNSNAANVVAFIVFRNYSKLIFTRDHQIGKSQLTVKNVDKRAKFQKRFRCRTILLEELPDTITQEEIASYFKRIGEISLINILTNKFGKKVGLGYVHFAHAKHAHSAAQKFIHEIGGSSIKVRVLGYLNQQKI